MKSFVVVRHRVGQIRGWKLGNPTNARRLEIVVECLTIFDGAQLAIDTTMVSPFQLDGTARRRAADHNGAALDDARKRKERTYFWLVGGRGRAPLVLGAEVGGMVRGNSGQRTSGMKCRAWLCGWRNLLRCPAARALATSAQVSHFGSMQLLLMRSLPFASCVFLFCGCLFVRVGTSSMLKGWTKAPVLNGWVQIVWGPRPKGVRALSEACRTWPAEKGRSWPLNLLSFVTSGAPCGVLS